MKARAIAYYVCTDVCACEGMRKRDKHSKSCFCWLLSFISRIDVHICMYLTVYEERIRPNVCMLTPVLFRYGMVVRQSGRICFSFALFFGSPVQIEECE